MTVYRTGTSNPQTIYAQAGDEPSKSDRCVGFGASDEAANDLVELLNRGRVTPEQVAAEDAEQHRALDSAWHSVWLHGNWRWLTGNMSTPEKEAAAAAVVRHWATYEDQEDRVDAMAVDLRWWR